MRAVRIFKMIARCSKCDFWNLRQIWDRNRYSKNFWSNKISSKKNRKRLVEKLSKVSKQFRDPRHRVARAPSCSKTCLFPHLGKTGCPGGRNLADVTIQHRNVESGQKCLDRAKCDELWRWSAQRLRYRVRPSPGKSDFSNTTSRHRRAAAIVTTKSVALLESIFSDSAKTARNLAKLIKFFPQIYKNVPISSSHHALKASYW